MAWYIAKSLEVLRVQLNALAPHRSTVSDGGIGDPAHSARTSDHNPTAAGQVCARDFTHDPAGGLDCHWLARALVASRDPRIKYVIWDRKILDTRPGFSPWQWKPYSGTNPHTKHLHLSVHSGAIGDQTGAWNLGNNQEDDMFTPADFERLMWGNVFDGPTPGGRNFASFIKDMDAKLTALAAKAAGASAEEIAAKLLPALTTALVAEVAKVDAISDADAAQIAEAVTARAGVLLGGGA